MNDTARHPDLSLPELLSEHAHGASTLRLALDLALGAVATTVVLLLRPTGWLLMASASLCFTAFGIWGLADRVITWRTTEQAHDFEDVYMPDFSTKPVSDTTNRVLRAVEGVAVLVGVLAALLLVFGTLALLMGTMIS
jgi:hypothetical protein